MSIKRETVEERKALPIASGVLDYFPDALLAIAEVSRVGNEQHHPGEPLHWDKSKSTDEADALMRHLIDRGTVDTDGLRHTAKVAWRALALLQRELDAEATKQPVTMGPGAKWQHGVRVISQGVLSPEEVQRTAGLLTVPWETYGLSADHPSARVGGLLVCCGGTEHSIACPNFG